MEFQSSTATQGIVTECSSASHESVVKGYAGIGAWHKSGRNRCDPSNNGLLSA